MFLRFAFGMASLSGALIVLYTLVNCADGQVLLPFGRRGSYFIRMDELPQIFFPVVGTWLVSGVALIYFGWIGVRTGKR